MQDLVIFGAGGLGREVRYTIDEINERTKKYNLLGYIVDEEYFNEDTLINGYPMLGTEDWIIEHKDTVKCCMGLGFPKDRMRIMQRLEKEGVKFETLVHPDSIINETSILGDGCIVQADCRVSCDVNLGKGVLLNGDIGIGHDCEIGDYVTIFPGCKISGFVRMDEASMIGSMSFINSHTKIGESAVVAAGSIVFRNVKAGTTVMGNPAKRMKALEDN